MMNRTVLAREALRAAIELRTKLSISEDAPICIYNAAVDLGVEVRFFGGDSFDGMYIKDSELILVPSLRPYGRQAFSCAHELGHWYFKHGSRVDLLSENLSCAVKSDEEYLADTFAGYMLMPPWAVKRMFSLRGLSIESCSPIDFYKVSSQLGVGYETLVDHLYYSLGHISAEARERLLATGPKEIREGLLGKQSAGARHLTIADAKWEAVAIDLQVGDVAIVEHGHSLDGRNAGIIGDSKLGPVIKALRPGLSTISSKDGGWSAFVRVSHKNFEGRSIFRHLGDPDVD